MYNPQLETFLLLMHRGWSHYVDQLRYARTYNPKVNT